MYTIDKIENNYVMLLDNKNNDIIIINKDIFNDEINEGDIVEKKDDEFIINKIETNKVKENIREKFNALIG